ncbi:hypothetical protein PMSD_20790 [Paenibacillus macquariensis subsp. defensor]|nr:hypothetical protein PMSD_20790 [Paenibacillus macquariensis subsp. defensor]
MNYYVLLFETGKRDNILKVISEPVPKEDADKIMGNQNKFLDLSKEYADTVPANISNTQYEGKAIYTEKISQPVLLGERGWLGDYINFTQLLGH